ncbi:hypothetical protein [Saccharophagus degradans]|uniref:Uncharacterized protein n=1 Tax=Saccharophagus degradans TaxID=86304 RepID=A0AAW7X659_9GAMM|nr:hypothetical protein [Saccharophagus degradans]MDO6422363.1 hypothetical protein [Saccharophagus degradans]MDO6608097.1 hypothetical protein [Saccharophagus degradans]
MTVTCRYIYRLTAALLLCSSCALAFAANTPQTQNATPDATESQISTAEQVATIEEFYAKRLVGLEPIRAIFPAAWLTETPAWNEEKNKLQQHLAALSQADPKDTSPHELELTQLKLIWVLFTPAERSDLINSAKTQLLAQANKQNAQKILEQTQAAASEHEKQLQQVKHELAQSEDDREKRLLAIQLGIEKRIELITAKTKLIADAQIAFSQDVSDWKEIQSLISNALDDEHFIPGTRDFTLYRKTLRDRLAASNRAVVNKHVFVTTYFRDDMNLPEEEQSFNVQVRETDSDKNVERVNTVLRKRLELSQSEVNFIAKKQALIVDLAVWHKQYRTDLLLLRGKLIKQVIDNNAFSLNNFDPITVELRTLYASTLFSKWGKAYVKTYGTSKKTSLTFSNITHLLKVLLTTCFIVWLFLKRQLVLDSAKRWCLTRTSNARWRKATALLFGALQELYIFIILFFFGGSVIEILVSVGISSAEMFKPVLNKIVLFFLLLGLIQYIRPFLSQREQRKGRDTHEIAAIEEVFSLVPQVYLYYWLAAGIVASLISQHLNESLLGFHAANVIALAFSIALLIIIWVRRHTWRTINEKAYSSELWQKISLNARRKPWEPLILLIGGGMGVYRVVWSVLLDRLTELELTRSFQAMVSRAILERQYRKTTTKLYAERFPDKYWRNFHFQTPAEAHWYVERSEHQAAIQTAYENWQSKGKATRLLICGDRGVGKSELISKFLRNEDIPCLHTHIDTGETSVAAVCQRLSLSFLQSRMDTPEDIINALKMMEPQVLCVENIENTILRKVGGFAAYTAVIDIILQTSDKHFWLVTCTSYAWTIVQHGVIGADCFTENIMVEGLSEEALKTAMLARHNDAHPTAPDFSQLNFSNPKQGRLSNKLQQQDASEKGEELYFRILWDYTKGNPRQALYYWKASLAWDGLKCTVRLFEIPEHRVLETLQDRALMLLAGLIEHNGLTLRGMQEIMNCPEATVRRHIEELTPYGIVFSLENDDSCGWHVESFWTRAVENYLEKRQLLFKGAAL